MLFFSILNLKNYSIKPRKCYKICNTATMHSHFWERTVAVLYNILFIYLFSLQLFVSHISLFLWFSLRLPHLSHFLIPSLSLSLTTRLYVWDRLGGEENNMMAWDRRGGDRRGDRCGDQCVMRFLVVVVAGVLWFLWWFFVVLVVVVSCCDRSCGYNVWWVSVVLGNSFGWDWDQGGGFWLGLKWGGWVVVEVGCCGWGMGLGFDGFLYPSPPSLPLTVRLLFLKFSFLLLLLLLSFFFFWAIGLIFGWMLIVVAVGCPWVWVCCAMLMVYGGGG